MVMAVMVVGMGVLVPVSGATITAGAPTAQAPHALSVVRVAGPGVCYVSIRSCSLHPCTELIGANPTGPAAAVAVSPALTVAPVVQAAPTPRPTLTCRRTPSRSGGTLGVASAIQAVRSPARGASLVSVLPSLQHRLSARLHRRP
jgi:hypothetical protein